MAKEKTPAQADIENICRILGDNKINWGRAVKLWKEAKENGFDSNDFEVAATNMVATAESKYWSIYSVLSKTDYWLRQEPGDSVLKGVW